MGLTLQKGGNLSLSKTDPGLKVAMLGLGWDPRTTDGKKFDLDASAFLLDANGKVRSNADFVFYHQVNSGCGSVTHTGDNQTGEGEGDDETILVDFAKVPAVVEKIVLTVTIHDAALRGQNFGQVGGAKIRVVNNDTQNEIVKYDLSEDYSTETAMIFGELYRHGTEWKFRAVGQGFNGGLEQMCAQFGVQIDG